MPFCRTGAEYAAPISGSNIQPVQLEDLNGDGQEEAVAFFRNDADEKPLKICIFTAKDQTYELFYVIESAVPPFTASATMIWTATGTRS